MVSSAPGPHDAALAPTCTDPEALLQLVNDSGRSFAVIEDAIRLLKRRMAQIDLSDPAVAKLLKIHLRAVGSPSSVGKFFSLELLGRIDEDSVLAVALDICRMLAGMELKANRSYPIECELLLLLGKKRVDKALPPLALIAAQQAGELSRTAARTAALMAGSRRKNAIARKIKELDNDESHSADDLAQAIVDALKRRNTVQESQSALLGACAPSSASGTLDLNAADLNTGVSTRGILRPERRKEKQRRLVSILREAGRNPQECGNCGQNGQTRVSHIIPVNRGGSERPGNLISLCALCWRQFTANRRDSSSVRRRIEEFSSQQMSLF